MHARGMHSHTAYLPHENSKGQARGSCRYKNNSEIAVGMGYGRMERGHYKGEKVPNKA